ncbi:PKD domain-containing protein [Methanofollis aquaemaris]|uniref:PKD domain-containing protein n=1 Tax=Methanofollis aquaemaris TaxID=126734 RepID=A0A8A3S985_9EURY|nr:NosD domain-containing protein [Methanofollis aquaemaris]QSZ68174.1 PKD domain-containing protein [Methanofollis aquaemaris]
MFLLFLLLAGLLLAAPVSAGFQTTEVTVVKLAEDGETALDERTVDYRWMEENLPIVGDGVTHYYMQGPTFVESNPWDPEETENVNDYHAMRGTDVRDLCNLVGGMGPDDIIHIYPNDPYSAMKHPYKNVYYTDTEHGGNPEQGPLVLTWWRPDDGYVPDYDTGMRTFFFATTTNAKGQYVFGNDDMRRFLDEEYWTRYEGWPCSRAQCQKYVKRIEIKSHEPVPPFPITIEANRTTGYLPLTVQFTGATEAASPTDWHWDFDDGATENVQNPTHTYEKGGLFNVSLTVTAADGKATKTRYQYIAAQERPVPTTLDVLPPEATVIIDGTQVFTAMVRDQKGRMMKDVAVEWSSSNTTVGTIDDGVFKALAEGTTTVTASTAGISGTAGVSVVPVPPEPKTWYVDDDGPANFTSIQAAVYACNPGDTVVVKDGEYTENVVVDRPIVLRSENGPETTVLTTSDIKASPVTLTAENVTVEGLTVKGGIVEGTAGVLVDHADRCTLRAIRTSENYDGVFLNASAGTLITGITADAITGSGIRGTDANGTVIEGCRVEVNNRMAKGISLAASEGPVIRECSITTQGEPAYGIVLSRTDNARVVQNTLKHLSGRSAKGITASSSWNVTIEKNTVSSYGSNAINVGIRNSTICGNMVSGGHAPIGFGGEHNLLCDNIVSNGYNGIYCSAKNSTITNNTCVHNDARALWTLAGGNAVYLNDLLEKSNRPGVRYTSWQSDNSVNTTARTPEAVDYIYNGTLHHGYLGNYYFDYEGTDDDGDGVGETPYNASADDHDFYPLVAPVENYEILPPMQTIMHGPYITGTTGTETTINWRTDVPTAGRVDYAPAAAYADGNYTLNVADGEETCLHHVALTGLEPGTTYHYRVTAGRNVTQDFTFETFPEAGERFTFITYGDSQEQIPYYTQLERHKLVADRIAVEEEDALFILHLGDTVSQAQDPTEWDRFFASARPMLANTTLYTALGNHEEKYKNLAEETFALPPWYSFECGDLHVVVLDSTSMKGSEMAEQTEWLRADLATDGARWTIAAFHHPPYNSGGHHGSGWPDTGWRDAFEEKGTAAVFNGHVHSYQRHLANGTQFIIAATGGGMQYELEDEKKPEYQAGMEYILGYERVTVDPANETVTMEFVPVADISEDNREVAGIRPPGEVFDRVVIGGAGGPDLAPVTITTDGPAVAGEKATVVVTVENLGGTEAGAFAVNLTADGASLGEQEAAALPAGETATFAFAWSPATSGSHAFVATVEGPPGERERENNVMKKQLYVLSPGEGPAFKEGAIELAPGWNLVSVPKRLAPGNDTALIFAGVESAGHSLCTFDAGTQCWQALGPDDPVTPLTGVLVYAEDAAAVSLTFDNDPIHLPPAKALSKGWNFVGAAGTDAEPAALALVSAEGRWERCVGYDALRQVYEAPVTVDLPDHALFPGRGYWLGMNENGTLAGTAV